MARALVQLLCLRMTDFIGTDILDTKSIVLRRSYKSSDHALLNAFAEMAVPTS